MTATGEKLIQSAKEAIAIAKGEQPGARITIKGHTYVPLEEYERLRAALGLAINWIDPNSDPVAMKAGEVAKTLRAIYQQKKD